MGTTDDASSQKLLKMRSDLIQHARWDHPVSLLEGLKVMQVDAMLDA
jgi:hypothetical protein